MTNNVKQEEYKPTFSDIVDLVRDEWNSYSKDGDIGQAVAAVLVDKAIEPQVNQQVVQALEKAKSEAKDIGFGNGEMVSVNQLEDLIKEYKGDKG